MYALNKVKNGVAYFKNDLCLCLSSIFLYLKWEIYLHFSYVDYHTIADNHDSVISSTNVLIRVFKQVTTISAQNYLYNLFYTILAFRFFFDPQWFFIKNQRFLSIWISLARKTRDRERGWERKRESWGIDEVSRTNVAITIHVESCDKLQSKVVETTEKHRIWVFHVEQDILYKL